MNYFDGPKPRLFAHRGSSGTHPENTLESFRAGLAAGAERLELDVHASRDGVVVVAHDETVDRMTGRQGRVCDHTFEELRELDAGFGFVDSEGARIHSDRGIKIPTLAEVFEAFPGVPLNIEIKQLEPAMEQAVLELLDRFEGREQVVVASHDAGPMARLRKMEPGLHTGTSAAEVASFVGLLQTEALDSFTPLSRVMQIPTEHEGLELATPALVDSAHELGIEVHVWTINDAAEVRRLLEMGVDGIMSDFPAMAFSVFQEMGLR